MTIFGAVVIATIAFVLLLMAIVWIFTFIETVDFNFNFFRPFDIVADHAERLAKSINERRSDETD